jgi:Sporulation and spore germination
VSARSSRIAARQSSNRPRRAVAAAVVFATVVLGACGIGVDARPRDIPPDQKAPLLGGSVPVEAATTRSAKVFFFGAEQASSPDRLQSANRSVLPTPEAVVRELLAGLSDADVTRNLRTAIPVGTTLRSAILSGDGTAVVDLSEQFFEARGEQQVQAVAQIVYSLGALDGVTSVRLLIDGTTREWPRGDGIIRDGALTNSDFAGFSPTSEPDYLPVPSPTLPSTAPPPITLVAPNATVATQAPTTTAPATST